MRGIAPTSVGLPVEHLDAHLLHQRRNVLAPISKPGASAQLHSEHWIGLHPAEKICA